MTAELYRFAIANLTHGLDAQFGLPPKTTLSQVRVIKYFSLYSVYMQSIFSVKASLN